MLKESATRSIAFLRAIRAVNTDAWVADSHTDTGQPCWRIVFASSPEDACMQLHAARLSATVKRFDAKHWGVEFVK